MTPTPLYFSNTIDYQFGHFESLIANIHSKGLSFNTYGYLKDISFDQLIKKIENKEFSFKITSAEVNLERSLCSFVGEEADFQFLCSYVRSALFRFYVWGKDLAATQKRTLDLIKEFPTEKENQNENLLSVNFWRWGLKGEAVFSDRYLECPKLEDITENYDLTVQKEINKLIALPSLDNCGKIILWHGPPGTGKTHMIRAVARTMKNKLITEVILDPDNLFNNSEYFYSLLMQDEPMSFDEEGFPEETQKTRLLIIEDHSELFSKDNGCRLTPGFSRLLNVTDGLLGQGQKLIFLLTSNEPLERIDEALLRSGRCLMNLEFPPLSTYQANDWLKKKGLKDTVDKKTSLSDLYAMLNHRPTAEEITPESKSSFGFITKE